MKNNYDTFFKSVQAKKMQNGKMKKIDLKKVRKENSQDEQDTKAAISNIHKNLIKRKQQRMRKQFPVMAGVFMALALCGVLFVGYNSEKFEEILSTIEIKILGTTASAAESSTPTAKNAETKDKKAEESAASAEANNEVQKERVTEMTAEELALFKNLDERRRALDQREAELKKLDEELQKQKEELDRRLVEIEKVRKNIANQLEEKVKVDGERVDQLVSFYSTMKPQQAAKIIETLNEDLAVEVLLKMKKKSAAEVMNLMSADKAQRLSEKFAGYRRK